MLAAMNPALDGPDYVFCATIDARKVAEAAPHALGTFREAEGLTLILERGTAEASGFDASQPMRRIVLQVNSALDGVGLTAAVASALAEEDIPCNVVAAFHHDHVFVPAEMAERALAILKDLEAKAG
jgi:uncharacterized protein